MSDDPYADDLLARIKSDLPRRPRWLTIAVGLLAVVQLVIVVPWLVGRDPWRLLGFAGEGHVARDGALGLVVALAAVLTLWRPRWALPCFILASLAVLAQALAGAVDAGSSGEVSFVGELVHVPSVALACLIGLAAAPLRTLGPARR